MGIESGGCVYTLHWTFSCNGGDTVLSEVSRVFSIFRGDTFSGIKMQSICLSCCYLNLNLIEEGDIGL